jgi:hypothetical protein
MASLQSIDELLESAVLALYRQWSHLPRRTTMPALEHAAPARWPPKWPRCRRHPTPRQLRRAAAAFAVAALRLAAGAARRRRRSGKTGRAERRPCTRPGGLRGAPLLKTTPLTPERVQALIALLRAEDPPAYAVQRWFYVANETPEAWRTLRAAVDPLLDRLAHRTYQQVQALDALLATAPVRFAVDDARPSMKMRSNSWRRFPASSLR